MNVACVLLHGAPLVGKSSVKRLLLNCPPLKENSTELMEDPVRAVSTSRTVRHHQNNLEVLDEAKLIDLIQKEVKSYKCKKERKDLSKLSPKSRTHLKVHGFSESVVGNSGVEKSIHSSRRSDILAAIAKDLDSVCMSSSLPPLFKCQFLNIVDSGGQPQFSDLLPLLFNSHPHDHIVVIPLNQKLSHKQQNSLYIDGKTYEFPGYLLLTHHQLIERVCQVAKAFNSKVIVVGTHLDEEIKEEPLEKKNEILKCLLQKYPDNIILNNDDVIFAVNAIAPEGEERTKYTAMLQEKLLNVCAVDSSRDFLVPLRWMVLELELSRRSKESGIIKKSECDEIAQYLGITDESVLDEGLTFFKNLSIHYHYYSIPNVIFTSILPISSCLSQIVKDLSLQNRESRKLQKTGILTQDYFHSCFVLHQRIDASQVMNF